MDHKDFQNSGFLDCFSKTKQKSNTQCGAPSEEERRAANGLCKSVTKLTIVRP